MSARTRHILAASMLMLLTGGLSVRGDELPFPNGGTEVFRQLEHRAGTRSRRPVGRSARRSANNEAAVRHRGAGRPAPFPADDPPPNQGDSSSREAFFTRRPAAVSQPRLETPDWISRTGPLLSQTHFVSPLTQPIRTRGSVSASAQSAIGQAESAAAATDGTWKDDGGVIIINLGGRELRLRKEGAPVRQTSYSVSPERTAGQSLRTETEDLSRLVGSRGGTVVGRLLTRGKPLVNCRVALIPIEKSSFGSYNIDAKSKPQSATTDETGNYRVENVPAGLYKLFWLPAGTRRWIRRIQFEPDAIVRGGERVEIKTVRLAVRTVNR